MLLLSRDRIVVDGMSYWSCISDDMLTGSGTRVNISLYVVISSSWILEMRCYLRFGSCSYIEAEMFMLWNSDAVNTDKMSMQVYMI